MKKNIKATTGKKQGTEKREKSELLRGKVQRLMDKLAEPPEAGPDAVEIDVAYYIGIDLGDKNSSYCLMDEGPKVRAEGEIPTTAEAFRAYFSPIPRSRIALEVGTHSPWVNELLESHGHEVFVANPRKMESIKKSKRKNDKEDARKLARQVRSDPELLYPIRHRGVKAREDLVVLRARDGAVRCRSMLINCVRGLVKSIGGRLPKCDGKNFHRHAEGQLPEGIRDALQPLVKQIETLTELIDGYDARIEKMATDKYPETDLLQQVSGVGPITSLAFVLTIEKPERFRKSREVGPYLGLVPKQDDSGETIKQLRITKTGDQMVRRLLVSSAQCILRANSADSDLRRFGERLAERGGKNAKKRAVTAVARKLGVLLHRLWVTAEVYEPLRSTRLQEKALAQVVNG